MLRFDYNKQENGIVEVKVISEVQDASYLCGKLTMKESEWDILWKALIHTKEKDFKFVNKGEK